MSEIHAKISAPADQGWLERLQSAEPSRNELPGRFFAALYDELRRMAHKELRRNVAMTLSPTTLLHETFLNISQREDLAFSERSRFMGYAARTMRGLVINHLRSRNARKRGGALDFTSLSTELPFCDEPDAGIERLNEALEALAQVDPRLAECVDLKFFCGFSFGEIARMRNVAERTVQRDWEKARVLINRYIND